MASDLEVLTPIPLPIPEITSRTLSSPHLRLEILFMKIKWRHSITLAEFTPRSHTTMAR